jgi:hypothetical protein
VGGKLRFSPRPKKSKNKVINESILETIELPCKGDMEENYENFRRKLEYR